MLDIIIIICCILGGFLLGKFIENKIIEKGKFYKDLTRYVSTLRENVSGRQLELFKFNEEFSKTCSKSFADYLRCGKLKLTLKKSQKENVEVFFNNLNCASSQALIQHLDYQGKILADDGKEIIDKEMGKASICSKLGMLLGAMLGILLV